MTLNQNPEQKACDTIDALLEQAEWIVQSKNQLDPSAGLGIAVRKFQTDLGPADYVLFVDRKACGVIEAKKESLAHKITEVEEQTGGYAAAKLKWVNNKEPLPFLYESTGIITRFTDGRDPKPRSREVFNFHRPETLKEKNSAPTSPSWRRCGYGKPMPSSTRTAASPINELTALVALIRHACGLDKTLANYDAVVRRNFQNWVLKHHAGFGEKFNEEQNVSTVRRTHGCAAG